MREFLRDVRCTSPRAKFLLVGALLLGTSQQLHFLLRNAWLVARGWASADVPMVQTVESCAGIVGGLLAIAAGRRSARHSRLLRLSAVALAAGLVMSTFSMSVTAVLVGAALIGSAIQLQMSLMPGLLRGATQDGERATVFCAAAIALGPSSGLAASCIAGISGGGTAAPSVAPLIIAAMSGFVGVHVLGHASRRDVEPPAARSQQARGVIAAALTVHGLVGLAGGMTLPFVHVHLRHGLGLTNLFANAANAGAMVASTLLLVILPATTRRFGLLYVVLAARIVAAPISLLGSGSSDLVLSSTGVLLQQALAAGSISLLHLFYQERSDGKAASLVSCFAAGSGCVAWAGGTAFTSAVARSGAGYEVVFRCAGFVYLVAAIAALVMFPRWRLRRMSGARTSTTRVGPGLGSRDFRLELLDSTRSMKRRPSAAPRGDAGSGHEGVDASEVDGAGARVARERSVGAGIQRGA